MTETILRVENLKTYFPIHTGLTRRKTNYFRAVDGITFDVKAGETLGVVGESGCGKSTMLRSIIGLLPLSFGTVELGGRPITMKAGDRRSVYKTMQMVFQDPYGSLDPRQTIGNTILEPLKVMHVYPRERWVERLYELLDMVGLNVDDADKFPHQFSGGQRQRVAIARALACNPKLVLLDEPVSALDVSIQAQVLNVLQDLQRELNLAYVFVSHDLSIVRYLSDRILVMQNGRMVEMADADELFCNPIHSYTRSLLDAIPIPDPDIEQPENNARDDSWEMENGEFDQTAQRGEEKNKQEWKLVAPNHYVAC